MPDEIPASPSTPSPDSDHGVVTKRFAQYPSKLLRGAMHRNADEVFSLPTPKDGGKLVGTFECGSCVANVYQHKDAPDFEYTVSFEHQVMKDGKPDRSPRLASTDLQAVRVLATKIGEMMMSTEPWQRRIEERQQQGIPNPGDIGF